MIHKSFISNSAAWNYISEQMKTINESSVQKSIIWNSGLDQDTLDEVLSSEPLKKIFEGEDDITTRQFVILMGGPSTGKGFLVATKFGEGFGLVNGKPMKDWLNIDTISMDDVREGDSILREIQRGISIIAFNRLYNASLAAGKKGFKAAIKEIFYMTKDRTQNNLSDHINYHDFMSFIAQAHDLGGKTGDMAHDLRIDKGELKKLNLEVDNEENSKSPDKEKISANKEKIKELKAKIKDQRIALKKAVADLLLEEEDVLSFSEFVNEKRELPIKQLKSILNQSRSAEPKSEDAFDEFFQATDTPFWKSMRGWKKDGAHGIERFKDAARKEFEKDIKERPANVKTIDGGNIIVVDSPGEDVAKQPYVGECEEAEKAGFVTNIINLDPRLGNNMVSLMRLANFSRNIDEGDRMVDDRDITGYADNVADAIHTIHANKLPRGPVHRYFHLVKDIDDKPDIIKILGALNGAKKDKDSFVQPKNINDDSSFREINTFIDKLGINILLANKLKKLPKLLEWWRGNVKKVIFGINPTVLYDIKTGETGSFNHEMSSKDILSKVEDRLVNANDEFADVQHDVYNKMVQSVDKWTKEYDEWTDRDTWRALQPIVDVKESKVDDFQEYINKINEQNGI
jgi:hypothetical protein